MNQYWEGPKNLFYSWKGLWATMSLSTTGVDDLILENEELS